MRNYQIISLLLYLSIFTKIFSQIPVYHVAGSHYGKPQISINNVSNLVNHTYEASSFNRYELPSNVNRDLSGSYLSASAYDITQLDKLLINFSVNINSSDFSNSSGIKIIFSDDIVVDTAFVATSNGWADVMVTLVNNNEIMFGDTVLSDTINYLSGIFSGEGYFTLKVYLQSTIQTPLNIDYVIYDDGWAQAFCTSNCQWCEDVGIGYYCDSNNQSYIVNAEGSLNISDDDITLIDYEPGTMFFDLIDITDNELILDDHPAPGVPGSDMPIIDGFTLNKGSLSYDTPKTFVDLIQQVNEPVINIYNQINSYYNNGWAETARAVDTYGQGTTDLDLLADDIEVRWTATVWDTISFDYGIYYRVISGGSWAWIDGARQYSLSDHPDPNNPGDGSPFRIRVPYEVWNVEDPENPYQIEISIYDRMQTLDGDHWAHNPNNRMYTHFLNIPYRDLSPETFSADSFYVDVNNFTWNVVWWETPFDFGDNITFIYDVGVTDLDVYQFSPAPNITITSISDISIDEDSYFETKLSAISHYSHPISFSAYSNDNNLNTSITNDTLIISTENNWFGTAIVSVIATEQTIDGLSDTTTFSCLVQPINDAPLDFSLISPSQAEIISVHEGFPDTTISFTWNESIDVDNDEILYTISFLFTDPTATTTIFSIDSVSNDSIIINPSYFNYILESADLLSNEFSWYVNSTDGQYTGFSDTLSFIATREIIGVPTEAIISSIIDVPNDQGGWVYVNFLKSPYDTDLHENRSEQYSIERLDENTWVNVVSGNAYGQNEYTYLCPTLNDSTSVNDGLANFRVIAGMDEGTFIGSPESGYSTDNIAPGVPTGFMVSMVNNGLELSWDLVQDEDFQYFIIDKSADSLFMTDQYSSFSTSELSFIDVEYVVENIVYYRIAAVDHAGNKGNYSNTISTDILLVRNSLVPDIYCLHQNYPNPFNPTTSLRYDLPNDGLVNITIYDMMGRIVKTLVNGSQTAGFKSVQWNATNDRNEPVSAGLYLYTIQAGEFRQTKKMVLLK